MEPLICETLIHERKAQGKSSSFSIFTLLEPRAILSDLLRPADLQKHWCKYARHKFLCYSVQVHVYNFFMVLSKFFATLTNYQRDYSVLKWFKNALNIVETDVADRQRKATLKLSFEIMNLIKRPHAKMLGWIVQRWYSANPGLKLNPLFFFFSKI